MAARENQGLQIALIIFVILTIMLIVSTYLFFQNYREAQDRMKGMTADIQAKSSAATKAQQESDQFKGLIGAATTDNVESVQALLTKDLEKYGKGVPEGKQNYRFLLESMAAERDAANALVAQLTEETATLNAKVKSDEAAKVAEIAEYTQKYSAASDDHLAEREKFKKQLDDITSTKDDLAKKFDDKRREFEELTRKSTAQISTLTDEKTKLTTTLVNKNNEELRKAKANEVPDGKITWVNQRSRTVWINVGTDDGLRQQTSFSVYGPYDANPIEGENKGKIEVIRLIDSHLAEAAIIEDQISDPLMPGDQIFSPTWEPGRAEHFALAGKLDFDDDGFSDLQLIRDLITTNGGIVDAEVDDAGKRTGTMSINTKYLVLGDEPKLSAESDEDASIAGFSEIIGEAQVKGVKTIPVHEFLDYMGYKVQDRTVNLGRKANPADFKPRLPSGVQRVVPGSTPPEYRTLPPVRPR